MKEFNIEQAKAGKPVCTRSGNPVRIICFDHIGPNPIIALVGINEAVLTYYPNGHYAETENPNDLMMVSEKHEGWINLYRDPSLTGGLIHTTKEEAESQKDLDCIATVKIEWEE